MSMMKTPDLAGSAPGGRKLVAVIYADMVGYSRLIGLDDLGTLERLQNIRQSLIDPAIVEHGGKIVQTGGDSLLIVFDSIDGAVRCAVKVQQQIPAYDGDHPPDLCIRFRIGISIGDAIPDGTDLHGEGVNIAARLQAECPPGAICVSRSVRDHVRDQLGFTFNEFGTLNLKNITRPVEAYLLNTDTHDSAPQLPDLPSIAVLPFVNLSGDPQQEYFADGMVEEIITALSRIRSLFVIARNSSFAYKGCAVDVRRVGRELGIRYVLEGSVRKVGSRVRIAVQLVEAATGVHVFADRYDGTVDDLLELQDRIAESVAGILEPTLQRAEIERVRRKAPGSLQAYDHYLRALSQTDQFTSASVHAMYDHCTRAISLDPDFAPSYVLAARFYIQRKVQGWGDDDEDEAKAAFDIVERGLRADRYDPLMVATAGQCFAWFGHDLVKGISYVDEALDINPNLAHAFMQSGLLRARAGQTALALEHLRRARRLSPRDSRNYAIFHAMAFACHMHNDVPSALEWARRAAEQNSNYLPAWRDYAAAAMILGRQIEAKAAVARVFSIERGFSISRLMRRYPTVQSEAYAVYLQGLRDAGVPE